MCNGCHPYAPATFTPEKITLIIISVRGLVDSRATIVVIKTVKCFGWCVQYETKYFNLKIAKMKSKPL